jgi:hypothetical protein
MQEIIRAVDLYTQGQIQVPPPPPFYMVDIMRSAQLQLQVIGRLVPGFWDFDSTFSGENSRKKIYYIYNYLYINFCSRVFLCHTETC